MPQRVKGACVGPPALEDAVGERSFFQIHIVDVGDLELTARRGSESPDLFKYGVIEEIMPGHRKIRFGPRRLFLDTQDLSVNDLWASESMRIVYRLQQEVCAFFLGSKSLRRLANVPFDHVVPKHHAGAIPVSEMFCQPQSV